LKYSAWIYRPDADISVGKLSLAIFSVVLLPVFLFAVLHSASYSLTLLDVSTVSCLNKNTGTHNTLDVFNDTYFQFADAWPEFVVGS
jgi:hypothetical protein